jgi:hypothetical protein
MNRQVLKRRGAAARMMVATLLAGAFICAALPAGSVTAGNLCRLECCATRAPHATGSCMNGACHAAIRSHKHDLHRSSATVPGEKFCGLKTLSKHVTKSIEQPATHESVVAFGRPCNADCGTCAVSSISARDTITIASAYRLRLQSTTRSIESHVVSSPEFSRRLNPPRGPPNQKV